MTFHEYLAHYVTCDWPGCTVQTGGFLREGTVKSPEPLAHWGFAQWEDSAGIPDKHFCPRHREEAPEHWA